MSGHPVPEIQLFFHNTDVFLILASGAHVEINTLNLISC